MSNEANALLRKLLASGIDATAFHCVSPPTPDDPSKPYPEDPRPRDE